MNADGVTEGLLLTLGMKEHREKRAQELFANHQKAVYVRTDKLFAVLLIVEWLAAILTAIFVSPLSWEGTVSSIHIHVWMAVIVGAVLSSFPLYLVMTQPGATITRHSVAIAQTLYSALFIHLSGGRIETHFHIFGSLALLAFYRDWRVLATATVVVAGDHLIRGQFWPQSVFGVNSINHWRWLEHAAWVIFEDAFLIRSCLENTQEMREIAWRRAELENMGKLKVQEERFRTLCALSPLGFIQTDWSGSCTFVNARWREITGQLEEHALSNGWMQIICDEDKRAFAEQWFHTVNTGNKFDAECRIVTVAGEIRWVRLLANAVRSPAGEFYMFIGQLEDIHERKQAEMATEALARIVELTDDAICSYDIDGNVISWNHAATTLYGFTAEEAACCKYSTVSPAQPYSELLSAVVHTGSLSNIEAVHTRKDGTAVPVAITVSAVRELGGKLTGVSIIVRDITERIEADKRIAEFYSTISHELRTPLTSIRGSLSLLEQGIVDAGTAQGKELIAIARSSSVRLVRLINEILDLRKIEEGKLTIHKASIMASSLVETAVASMGGMATTAGVALSVEMRSDAELIVDADRITQVIVNLISNALKFSPSGSKVVVHCANQDRGLRIAVTDEGPGIKAEDLHKLFGKFQQLDSSDSRPKEGTGLGLAICKALVEQHEGSIGVSSEPGAGSTFYFDLPIHSKVKSAGERIEPLGGQPVVLIVEDDSQLSTVLSHQLKNEGFHCDVVQSKSECVAYLRSHQPDVILLDFWLPDGHGLEVIDSIKVHCDPDFTPPIIVMSGDSSQQFALPTIFDFLVKPFDQDTLMRSLNRATKQRHVKRVLVVDDDQDARTVIAAQLKACGAEAILAADGVDAITILQINAPPPDLIILDVAMPNLNGFDVLDWLQQERLSVPIIVYSGQDLSSAQLEFISAKLCRYLVKGAASEEEFLSTVRALLTTVIEPARLTLVKSRAPSASATSRVLEFPSSRALEF